MESDDALQAAVDAVHLAVVNEAEKIIGALARRAAIHPGKLVEYCHQLHRLLPKHATPHWLKEVCQTFGGRFIDTIENDATIAKFVTHSFPELQAPVLVGVAALDLDKVFDEKRDQCEIPELFDKLVEQLSNLIAEDVIQHKTVAEAIQRLKAVLAKNRRGSLAAVLLTMNYGQFVLQSFRGVLEVNKYTKTFVDAFTEQFNIAQDAVNSAKLATEQETIRVLTHLKRLELFLEEHPDVEPVVAGYLPSSADSTADGSDLERRKQQQHEAE